MLGRDPGLNHASGDVSRASAWPSAFLAASRPPPTLLACTRQTPARTLHADAVACGHRGALVRLNGCCNSFAQTFTVLVMPPRRLILLVTLLALVGACSAPSGPATSSDGRSIVIGAGSEPDNLNPILGFAPDGASKIFDGLVSRDASLALVPALAEQVPTASPDGLTWTAPLRPGVTVLRRYAGDHQRRGVHLSVGARPEG